MIVVRDPLVNWLNKIVLYAVKFMAILMTLVIIWSIADVVIDYSLTSSTLIYAIAATILSVGVAHWLTSQKELAITDNNDRG